MAKSFLSKEQVNLLSACMAGANLAADIAHAHVYIYVRDEDPKYINVYRQALPLKEFVTHSASMAGRKLRLAEEPLVGRALQSGMIVSGKRESLLGSFAKIKIFAQKPLFFIVNKIIKTNIQCDFILIQKLSNRHFYC